MGLKDKIKKIFNSKNATDNVREIKEIPAYNAFDTRTLYYCDQRIIRTGDDDNPPNLTFKLVDEKGNPVENETGRVNLSTVTYDRETDKNGVGRLQIRLKKGKYKMGVSYPHDSPNASKYECKIKIVNEEDSNDYIQYDKNTGKKITQISSPNVKTFKKEECPYIARLMDAGYNPICGETLEVNINDEIYKEKTDENGYIRIPLNQFESGRYTVIANYEGNEEYCDCETKSKIDMRIRNADRGLAIEVKDLAMDFKVNRDKIDTLKEFIIRTIKRNKEETEKIRILDGINLNIYRGEKIGILGFNGAGKSTFLKILAGIYEPTEGSIKIHGKIAPLLELSAGFDKNYTGKNNIYLNGALLSMTESFIKEKYDEIVEFSELGEFINYPVKNYSSGMRAKLGFSIATLVNPDILIIDEILSVGDIKFRKKSSEKINSMMQEGVTVLLVSHSINQIKRICDRCIWLEDGKIIMDGDSSEVCDAYVKSAKSNKRRKHG